MCRNAKVFWCFGFLVRVVPAPLRVLIFVSGSVKHWVVFLFRTGARARFELVETVRGFRKLKYYEEYRVEPIDKTLVCCALRCLPDYRFSAPLRCYSSTEKEGNPETEKARSK